MSEQPLPKKQEFTSPKAKELAKDARASEREGAKSQKERDAIRRKERAEKRRTWKKRIDTLKEAVTKAWDSTKGVREGVRDLPANTVDTVHHLGTRADVGVKRIEAKFVQGAFDVTNTAEETITGIVGFVESVKPGLKAWFAEQKLNIVQAVGKSVLEFIKESQLSNSPDGPVTKADKLAAKAEELRGAQQKSAENPKKFKGTRDWLHGVGR